MEESTKPLLCGGSCSFKDPILNERYPSKLTWEDVLKNGTMIVLTKIGKL